MLTCDHVFLLYKLLLRGTASDERVRAIASATLKGMDTTGKDGRIPVDKFLASVDVRSRMVLQL